MKTQTITLKKRRMISFVLSLAVILIALPLTVAAEQTPVYTYYESFSQIVISGCTDKGAVEIVIPDKIDGMPVTCIDRQAFCDCTALERITLPQNLNTIQIGAFSGCSSLTSITLPESLESIREGAFRGSGITSLTLPKNVRYLAVGALGGCDKLTSLTVESGNEIYRSSGNCIIDKISKTLVAACYASVIPDDGSVETIGTGVFNSFTDLKSITVPKGIKHIASDVFDNCTSLTEVNLPEGLQTIGNYAFSGCTALERITLPKGLKVLGSAFDGCTALSEVILPEGLEEIDAGAFSGCTALVNINLPESLTKLGANAFTGCTNLAKVSFPLSLTAIDFETFSGCISLTDVVLPKKLTSLGSRAFLGCENLKSVTMPKSLVKIGTRVFDDCYKLKAIYYSGTEKDWLKVFIESDNSAFKKVTMIYLKDSAETFKDIKGNAWYKEAIDYVVTNNLMTGVSQTSFAPDADMSRAMLVTVLYRIEGEPSSIANVPFTDLKQKWYKGAVAWAYETGIVSGTSASTFSPDASITREQMATILFRYSDYRKDDVTQRSDLSSFPDCSKVSSWATDALSWANAVKLITGTAKDGKTYLDPQGKATRAQVATILMRYLQNK